MDDFEPNPNFFAPPAFRPEAALQRLRRELRDAGLTEREGRFEHRGQAVARAALSADGQSLAVALAKRPARTPEWQERSLRGSAQLRDWLAEVKQRLAAARDDE